MEESVAIVKNTVAAFDESVKRVEEAMRPLLATVDSIRQSDEDENITDLTKARAHATLAYALNALYYMYLRANAADGEEHPVIEEIERVQNLFSRIRAVERKMDKKENGENKATSTINNSLKKLEFFLTPEEEDLFHAVKGNTSKRERHKRFPVDTREKSELGKKKKQKTMNVDIDTKMTEKEASNVTGVNCDADMSTPVDKSDGDVRKKSSDSSKKKSKLEKKTKKKKSKDAM